MTERERIDRAIDVAVRYGGFDGAHHKAWVIDQMVRELTGCPKVAKEALDHEGVPYTYEALGESEKYRTLVVPSMTGNDALLAWALAHGLHRDIDERGRLCLVSATVGTERRSIAREIDPESQDFGRYHFARIAIATTETLERRWIDADPSVWSKAMGIAP